MKLEAIDPEHPARFCVVSVAEIMGEYFLKIILQSKKTQNDISTLTLLDRLQNEVAF